MAISGPGKGGKKYFPFLLCRPSIGLFVSSDLQQPCSWHRSKEGWKKRGSDPVACQCCWDPPPLFSATPSAVTTLFHCLAHFWWYSWEGWVGEAGSPLLSCLLLLLIRHMLIPPPYMWTRVPAMGMAECLVWPTALWHTNIILLNPKRKGKNYDSSLNQPFP